MTRCDDASSFSPVAEDLRGRLASGFLERSANFLKGARIEKGVEAIYAQPPFVHLYLAIVRQALSTRVARGLVS